METSFVPLGVHASIDQPVPFLGETVAQRFGIRFRDGRVAIDLWSRTQNISA